MTVPTLTPHAVGDEPPASSLPRWDLLRELPRMTTVFERARTLDGPISVARLGPERLVAPLALVTGPAVAAEVLSARSTAWDKGLQAHLEFERLMATNSFSMRHEPWRPRRRTLQPTMTRKHVNSFGQHMAKAVDTAIADWEDGTAIEAVSLTRRITLDALGRSLFATDLAARIDTLTPSMHRLMRTVTRRGLLPITLPGWIRHPRNRRDLRVLHAVLDAAIDAALERRRRAARQATAGAELVDLLLDATDPETGRGLSREEIRDELLVFLIAGHDTTATALAATLWLLARHPQIQERVAAEAAACGTSPLGAEDLADLSYTRQVLQEAMRLYPPAAVVGRLCVHDTTLAGYRIPAGWQAVVSIWAIHRDPQLWERPTDFDPEHFVTRHAAGRDRWAYLPFGAGPRACIGDHFAMLEATIVVATIVRAFHLATDLPELEVATPFTLTIEPPVPLRIRRR